MSEVTRYKAILETRELTREGFGLMGAAELASKLTGYRDPVSLALQAGQAELACARCKAALLAARLKRHGITTTEENDE